MVSEGSCFRGGSGSLPSPLGSALRLWDPLAADRNAQGSSGQIPDQRSRALRGHQVATCPAPATQEGRASGSSSSYQLPLSRDHLAIRETRGTAPPNPQKAEGRPQAPGTGCSQVTSLSPWELFVPQGVRPACSPGGAPSLRPPFPPAAARGRTDAVAPILAPVRFPAEAGGGGGAGGEREGRGRSAGPGGGVLWMGGKKSRRPGRRRRSCAPGGG